MIIDMKGNLKIDTVNSLFLTLKQYYKEVNIKGKGKKRKFYCTGEYLEKQLRKTKYENCGQYKKTEDSKVLSKILLQVICDINDFNSLHSDIWLIRCNVISDKLYNAVKLDRVKKDDFKKLVELKILEETQFEMLNHYLNYEITYLRNSLKSAFRQLRKNGEIQFSTDILGKESLNSIIEDDECETVISKYRILSEEEINGINILKINLRRHFKVTSSQIYLSPNDKKVKEYKQMYNEILLTSYNLLFTFEAYSASCNENTDLSILELSKGDLIEEFKITFSEKSSNCSKDRNDKYLNSYSGEGETNHIYILSNENKYVEIWERLHEYYFR